MSALGEERASDRERAAPAASDGAGSAAPFLPGPALPKGGGAIRGMGEKFAVNPARGTGSSSVPIALSPGRSAIDPELVLGYDSGVGNSLFGLGFDVRLPAVSRRTGKGVPCYDDTDVYLLSDAEDLVPVTVEQPDGSRLPDVRTLSSPSLGARCAPGPTPRLAHW